MEDVTLHVGDCLHWLLTLEPQSVDLIFADPPFNIGYEYDQYEDNRPDYFEWCDQWLWRCKQCLRPGGSIYVAIGDEHASDIDRLLEAHDLTRRNWLIWYYTFGNHLTRKFGRNKAHILYATKGDGFMFNADDIRVPSARQEKYHDKRADARGRVPGDVWEFSRVCGTFKERTAHPCQMPLALLERVVLASSNPGDVVLDPFAGSGTTLVAARKHGRKAVGIELSPNYAEIIRGRLERGT